MRPPKQLTRKPIPGKRRPHLPLKSLGWAAAGWPRAADGRLRAANGWVHGAVAGWPLVIPPLLPLPLQPPLPLPPLPLCLLPLPPLDCQGLEAWTSGSDRLAIVGAVCQVRLNLPEDLLRGPTQACELPHFLDIVLTLLEEAISCHLRFFLSFKEAFFRCKLSFKEEVSRYNLPRLDVLWHPVMYVLP